MMHKLILSIIVLFATALTYSKEVAFSFDDAPRGNGKFYTGLERTQQLIRVLSQHHITTVFFSNPVRLDHHNGRERLSAYAAAGHFIANHTHSHPDLNRTEVTEYIANITQADGLLSSFSTFKKWFRFPYLHEGRDIQKRDAIQNFLKENHYRNGYVTVDNYDYFIDHLVQNALDADKSVDMNKACHMLTDLMLDGLHFYDQLARTHIGQVRHVLLMHENDIEAFCLGQLISTLQTDGWTIISPERAFQDPLMQREPNTLYLNQGRVAAYVHEKIGQRFISQWEDEEALTAEFNRRHIAN